MDLGTVGAWIGEHAADGVIAAVTCSLWGIVSHIKKSQKLDVRVGTKNASEMVSC